MHLDFAASLKLGVADSSSSKGPFTGCPRTFWIGICVAKTRKSSHFRRLKRETVQQVQGLAACQKTWQTQCSVGVVLNVGKRDSFAGGVNLHNGYCALTSKSLLREKIALWEVEFHDEPAQFFL